MTLRKAVITAAGGSNIDFSITIDGISDRPVHEFLQDLKEWHGVKSTRRITWPSGETRWSCEMERDQGVDLCAMGRSAFSRGFELQDPDGQVLRLE